MTEPIRRVTPATGPGATGSPWARRTGTRTAAGTPSTTSYGLLGYVSGITVRNP